MKDEYEFDVLDVSKPSTCSCYFLHGPIWTPKMLSRLWLSLSRNY